MSAPAKPEKSVCVLLPNKEQLDITVGVKATGQDVFNRVSEMLGIKELYFFGLTVVKDNEHIFLDLEDKLSKYFPKEWKQDSVKGPHRRPLPLVLCLKVQYYVENGRLICERKARRLYYSDLRERVLRSECRQQEEVYFQLAGYALQADLEDQPHTDFLQDQDDEPYFQPKEYFPPWIEAKRGLDYLLRHGPKVHRELSGMTSRDAVLNFIKESCRLEDVPVTFYRLQKDKKEEKGTVLLGLTLRGMQLYQEVNNIRQLLFDFPWSNVGRLTFLGKKFEIQPDGLPSARKLVYYTGSPFRSRHLLLHLSSSHRLYLSLQPALTHLRQLEETEEKKRYRESYISDEMELDPPGSEDSPGPSQHSASSPGLSQDSTGSPGLSRHTPKSPSLSQHSTQNTGLSRHTTGSPSLSRHSTEILDLSRHSTKSPSLSRHSTKSPSLSQHSTQNTGLSRHSTGSPGLSRHSTSSSGIEADGRQHSSILTEPVSLEEETKPRRAEKCFSSAASHSSSHTSGVDMGSKEHAEEEWLEEEAPVSVDSPGEVSVDDPEEMLRLADILEGVSVDCPLTSEALWRGSREVSVDSHDGVVMLRNKDSLGQVKPRSSSCVDRHSQSLDDVRLFPPPTPLGTTLLLDSSHSYTFGLPDPQTSDGYYLPLQLHCPPKSSFYGRRSTNCLSLDMLGDEQLLEFIL